MKSKNNEDEKHLSPAMVEDDATERLKKRARDLGLFVNAGAGKNTEQAGQKKDDRKKTEAKQ